MQITQIRRETTYSVIYNGNEYTVFSYEKIGASDSWTVEKDGEEVKDLSVVSAIMSRLRFFKHIDIL